MSDSPFADRAIYFPLRSNLPFFNSGEAREALERRMKFAAVLYDDLVFENARHHLVVWKDGSMNFHMQPGAIPHDRSEISYYSSEAKFEFKISTQDGQPIGFLGGPDKKVKEAHEIDFHPLLSDAGLLSEECIKLLHVSPTQETKNKVKQEAQSDYDDEELRESIPGNHYQRKALLKNLRFDSYVSAQVQLPFGADPRSRSFIQKKSQRAVDRHWSPKFDLAVLINISAINLPDFGQMPWEEVFEIRESAAGRDLRVLVGRMANLMAESLRHASSSEEIESEARKLYAEEASRELCAQKPDLVELAARFALNLLPLGGLAETAANLTDLVEHNQSWVSLIEEPPRNT